MLRVGHVLREWGIAAGMRALDVGRGGSDVSFTLAQLVVPPKEEQPVG